LEGAAGFVPFAIIVVTQLMHQLFDGGVGRGLGLRRFRPNRDSQGNPAKGDERNSLVHAQTSAVRHNTVTRIIEYNAMGMSLQEKGAAPPHLVGS
jgi:hypothetical protein